MIWATYSFFKSIYSLLIYNQTLEFLQLAVNLQKSMIFAVSNDGIQWTLDFGPDSVTIAANDLVQIITISSQEVSLAAWQVLLCQRQDFLDYHLAQVPVTPNLQGTHEMGDEVLSSVGAQYLDTSSYQLTDLEDIEFNWENSQLQMDAVFRPGIETPFFPTPFDDSSMQGSVENLIVLDEEEHKENAAPPSLSTPVSVRPKEPLKLQKSCAFGSRKKMCPTMFIEICFNKYYRVCVLI